MLTLASRVFLDYDGSAAPSAHRGPPHGAGRKCAISGTITIMNLRRVFPLSQLTYEGPPAPFYFLVLLAIVGTVRSLIHMFAPDGGAQSIAGLAVNGEGGANLIAIFSQWGASQLLLALFYWVAILRYRFLVPFLLLVAALEQILRIGVGHLKPLVVAAPPPGAIGSYALLPLSLLAFLWSLRTK
jgi:hypothetical protein